MKFLFPFICSLFLCFSEASGQKYVIRSFDIKVELDKNAGLKITEIIKVEFLNPQNGILRYIPYKYKVNQSSSSEEQASMDLTSNGVRSTILENVSVEDDYYKVKRIGDYYEIKIGDKDKKITGVKTYTIKYSILNAINFFSDKSEFYYNLIGDKWDTDIEQVSFKIILPESTATPFPHFFATGSLGSKNNYTTGAWIKGNRIYEGKTTKTIKPGEFVTAGIVFPKGYLIKPNYMYRHVEWLILPLVVLIIMLLIWRKYGKDDQLTITTEYYPPEGVSPCICGFLIDESLDQKDLTVLIPYWGSLGYIKVREIEATETSLLGNSKDFEFTKLKNLPEGTMNFEQTLFNGIFKTGDVVLLSKLKNVLYTTMKTAKDELNSAVDKGLFYEKNSQTRVGCFAMLGLVVGGYGVYRIITQSVFGYMIPISFILSGLIMIIIARFMSKKTKKGNELYRKLAGFKQFILSVEKPRLEAFLREDPSYLDKVLPFAIVFGVVSAWQDKLKEIEFTPPEWYTGTRRHHYSHLYLSDLNSSLNKMSESFYSSPSTQAGSGRSWSSSGGSAGGGFGGGGGSSW